MSNIINDISKYTGLYFVDQEGYESAKSDEYFNQSLYIVGDGQGGEDDSHPLVGMFLGLRKISDFAIVDEYPSSAMYPDDKIYLEALMEQDLITGYNVYFKTNNTVFPLHSDAVRGYSYDDNYDVLAITFNDHGSLETFYVPLVDSGELSTGPVWKHI